MSQIRQFGFFLLTCTLGASSLAVLVITWAYFSGGAADRAAMETTARLLQYELEYELQSEFGIKNKNNEEALQQWLTKERSEQAEHEVMVTFVSRAVSLPERYSRLVNNVTAAPSHAFKRNLDLALKASGTTLSWQSAFQKSNSPKRKIANVETGDTAL